MSEEDEIVRAWVDGWLYVHEIEVSEEIRDLFVAILIASREGMLYPSDPRNPLKGKGQ